MRGATIDKQKLLRGSFLAATALIVLGVGHQARALSLDDAIAVALQTNPTIGEETILARVGEALKSPARRRPAMSDFTKDWELLQQAREGLDVVGEALLEYETLDGTEIETLMKGGEKPE